MVSMYFDNSLSVQTAVNLFIFFYFLKDFQIYFDMIEKSEKSPKKSPEKVQKKVLVQKKVQKKVQKSPHIKTYAMQCKGPKSPKGG